MVEDRDSRKVQARARERVLRQAVADLEAEIRDLRAQRDALAEACEQLRGGAPAATRAAGGALAAPAEATGPPAALRRFAKLLIRSSLGAVRRIWRLADPAQRFVVATRPSAEHAPASPLLSVVVMVGDGDSAANRLGELSAQTAERLELAVWDRRRGTVELHRARGGEPRSAQAGSRDELVAALSGEYVATVPVGSRSLPTTLFETLQWLVASEALAYVRVFPSPIEDDGDQPPELLLCRRELWQPAGIDLEGLAAGAAGRPVLGKTVGLAGRLDAAVPRLATLGPGSRSLVCRTGRYDVWAGNRAGPVPHLLRPIPAAPGGADGDRSSVLVVAAAPLEGATAALLAATMRELRDTVRVVVATTAAEHALGVSRALQLEQLGATVYELGSTLAPEIWPSAIERIVSRFAPVAVLVAGRDPRLDGTIRRIQAAGVRIVALPVGDGATVAGADAWLVADAPPDAAGASGSEAGQLVPVPVGWLLPESRAGGALQPREQTRRELGVPSSGRLVVTAVDLVSGGRPEDVVVVADRLRQDAGIAFVLVGDGPLAGSVRDLIGFLGVDTIRLRRPRHSLEELAAAADMVLDPSCEPVARPLVAAALAAGTPVVTAPGGGAERLLAETGGGIVVSSVGAADELATAVRQLLADGRRPAQERARAVLARQRAIGSAAIRHALLGDAAAAAE